MNSNHTDTVVKSIGEAPWRILLIELLNLLGLVLTHSRHTRGVRATTVIFDQIIRRLHILDRMPGHPGAIIVRKLNANGESEKPDYNLTFGDQNLCRADLLMRSSHSGRMPQHLVTTLDQAFGSFQGQGIVSLFLQLPGLSTDKNDQLRLSLNILARFRQAAENNASITFRYFGRAMTIPLVRDAYGKPDPNLTLVAGLNGLSAVNMREIVKQAVSFCKLSTNEVEDECSADNYSKIFNVRGLRSQLIQPPVEINTLPPMDNAAIRGLASGQAVSADEPLRSEPRQDALDKKAERFHTFTKQASGGAPAFMDPFEMRSEDLDLGLEAHPVDLDSILDFDAVSLDAETLGRHLVRINKALHAMAAKQVASSKLERFLDFLTGRFEKLPETVLIQMAMQRRGLKIEFQGRKLIVGMVHPQLVELITLIREKRIAKQKIAACRDHAFMILQKCQKNVFTDLLEIYGDDADRILSRLKQCFDHPGGFHRYRFMECAEQFYPHENALFEMLWCIYRNNLLSREERQAYQIALPLLARKIKDATPAISFLLADLFQRPLQVVGSDCNAFALATLMLRTHHKEQEIDIHQTPEEVLAVRKSLNRQILEQVAWRLNRDRSGILFKFKLIRDRLREYAAKEPDIGESKALNAEFLLSAEREGLIFMALAGGQTALSVFREALAYYCDPHAEIYQGNSRHVYLQALTAHLQIVLRGMTRLGTPEDLDALKWVEQSAPRLMALDADPAYARRIKQALRWVVPAIRAIQVQL